ncbi:MAG: beta-galactosidase [Actinomycetota bacterium]
MADDLAWPWDRMIHGGDYNPEQWDEEVWVDDVRLMQEAGVNLVSVAIFSWALLEPEPDRFEFGWLDRVLDLLDGGGIGVNLANATASPPPWLAARHPETLPVTATGIRLSPGARQAYCPSSPIFRERAAILTERIAERYGEHPALRVWHVSNEYGCHVSRCYCDVSAAAFRRWLEERYGTLDGLNRAWGTNFWSQRYHRWEEVLPPRAAPSFPNPTQQLDFRRFSTDELIALFCAERDILRRVTPTVPVTTNFVIGSGFEPVDYWAFASHVDVVAIDHYTHSVDPEAHIELAYCADVSRGLAGGDPWVVMEHSTSAVNWQERNVPKRAGELQRHSLQHVARGADGAMFFQWRQSVAGAEKYHSAMVPHAGTDTKVWRDVVSLGAALGRLDEVVGTTVEASVALVYDWDSWWTNELDSRPSQAVRYPDQARALHRALWQAGITVDVVRAGASLDGYRLVLVPTLTMVDNGAIAELERFVAAGGVALVTYFSGIVDQHDHVRPGGYPGAFRDLLGIVTEELHPLADGDIVELTDGTRATTWVEHTHLRGAEAVVTYRTGPYVGSPAVTRHTVGDGVAWYLGTRLEPDGLAGLLDIVVGEAGVRPVLPGLPDGVEAVRRRGPSGTFVFVVNHGDAAVEIAVTGRDLLGGRTGPALLIEAGGVAVVAEDV